MLEAAPWHEAVAAQLPVAPAQQRDLVLHRVVAPEPGRGRGSGERDSRRPKRVPELGDERQNAALVVQPAEGAGDVALAILGPEVEIRHRTIAGELCRPVGQRLIGLAVGSGQLLCEIDRRRQHQPAKSVAGDVGDDVRAPRERGDVGRDFGLRQRVGPGGAAARVVAQVAGEVRPQVDRLESRRVGDGRPVVALDPALRKHAPVRRRRPRRGSAERAAGDRPGTPSTDRSDRGSA